MRVLLAGGGSGGSAAPVVAVAEALMAARDDVALLYVGTTRGPERALAREAGIPYAAIRTGRLRRYATWRNLTDPLLVGIGFAQALGLAARFRPEVAFGAGGFATVPPLLAARAMGAGVIVHQQDAVPSLANLMLAPIASRVTLAFAKTARCFPRAAPMVVGNPVRPSMLTGSYAEAQRVFGLEDGWPVVLVTGGGTGAVRLNRIVQEAGPALVRDAEVIHLTGAGRAVGSWTHPRYHAYEFLTGGMKHALAAADVVVSRAGMSALAEVAALGKPAVLVPMPNSHQEKNAALFAETGAAIVLDERRIGPSDLVEVIRSLLADSAQRRAMGSAAQRVLPLGAAEALCWEIQALAGDRRADRRHLGKMR